MISFLALLAAGCQDGPPPDILFVGAEPEPWYMGTVLVTRVPPGLEGADERVLVLAQPETDHGPGKEGAEIRLLESLTGECARTWSLGERVIRYEGMLPVAAWHPFSLAGDLCLAYEAADSREVKVLSLETNQTLVSLDRTFELQDALRSCGKVSETAELLCTHDNTLMSVRVSRTSFAVTCILRVAPPESVVAACFARGIGKGGLTAHTIVALVTDGGGDARVILIDERSRDRHVALTRMGMEASLRERWREQGAVWQDARIVAVAGSKGDVTVAIGLPTALEGIGVAAVVRRGAGREPALRFFGRATPRVDGSNSIEASLFGSSVTFLGDLSGDGIPEIAVGAPSAPWSTMLHVLSGSDGKELGRWEGIPTDRVGASACWFDNGMLLLGPALGVHPKLRFRLGRAAVVDIPARLSGQADARCVRYLEPW